MKNAPFHWKEEIPRGSIQQSSQSYSFDSGQRVLNILIESEDLVQAIPYIVGYSETQPKVDDASTGPYTLFRQNPARHPEMQGLVATKILSVTGKGLIQGLGDVDEVITGAVETPGGTYGRYKLVYISILFEVPRYPFFPSTVIKGENFPEYGRYTEWEYDANVETLSRRGVIWYAPFAPLLAGGTVRTFPGDRLLRQAKGALKAIWHDVHVDYVMLGRLIPMNFKKRIATVNSLAFPQVAYRDQNSADLTKKVQFGPGTLLLMPPKMTPHAQVHPAVLAGQLDEKYFPRTLDIEVNWIEFDPDTTDQMVIDLSAAKYGPGDANTPVRGHQLAPLPEPILGANPQIWFSWINTPNTSIVDSDLQLLYPYSNHEKLFAAVESS